jgi:hypothetical protein
MGNTLHAASSCSKVVSMQVLLCMPDQAQSFEAVGESNIKGSTEV